MGMDNKCVYKACAAIRTAQLMKTEIVFRLLTMRRRLRCRAQLVVKPAGRDDIRVIARASGMKNETVTIKMHM